jgi:hypothetical protein
MASPNVLIVFIYASYVPLKFTCVQKLKSLAKKAAFNLYKKFIIL